MKVQPSKINSTNFKAIYFENYNNKYLNIQKKVKQETEIFSNGHSNVTKIGEGVGGETFRFSDKALKNIVIKTTKTNYKDDYQTEYNNLTSIPVDEIGGQEPVARIYDSKNRKYALISTLVQGKAASVHSNYSDNHLKSLFDKMFILDKNGIYHGDLNGKNILLNNLGEVNFIDYQWTQIVQPFYFYDNEKVIKMLLPKSVFPENAQMFEMASMPYYIDELPTAHEKEKFLKRYLQSKANYHEKRAKHIATLEPRWYSSEKPLIRRSIREEKAKANVFKNPSDDILKLELKKIQFLSDYRDAYAHVDANLPDRNIIPSSSAYLCSLSAVQDLRKDIGLQLMKSNNSDKTEYLRSLLEYSDYWYNNLKEYTSSTFNYVMRAVLNRTSGDESRHKFYINERNPREFSQNRDLLAGVSSKYKTVFDRNFEVPYNLQYEIKNLYDEPEKTISASIGYDEKAQHQLDKVQNISKKSKKFSNEEKYLDLFNVSQLGILKIREFRSYSKHHITSTRVYRTLNSLLENSVYFTEDLFRHIFNGLKQDSTNKILVQGYEGMRKFKGKL